jgi:recombinational DNA repair protein (RecF pathway)
MSYSIYTTRAFVLGSQESGEASKIYSFYTEDFGLVRAKAQSSRLVISKLRFHLEDFSFGTFSFVRGKELWRVTGAEKVEGKPDRKRESARVLALVKRLVHGEEPNAGLFSALLALSDATHPSAALAPADFELKVLTEALSALGYLDLDALKGAPRGHVIVAVNKALKESQL